MAVGGVGPRRRGPIESYGAAALGTLAGAPVEGGSHEHHLWDVEKVRALVAGHGEARAFFCGGSRSLSDFADLFDAVFLLEVDVETLHRSGGSTPRGISIDATLPLARVVDEILRATAPETAAPPARTA